jgi:hypothetical protein
MRDGCKASYEKHQATGWVNAFGANHLVRGCIISSSSSENERHGGMSWLSERTHYSFLKYDRPQPFFLQSLGGVCESVARVSTAVQATLLTLIFIANADWDFDVYSTNPLQFNT